MLSQSHTFLFVCIPPFPPFRGSRLSSVCCHRVASLVSLVVLCWHRLVFDICTRKKKRKRKSKKSDESSSDDSSDVKRKKKGVQRKRRRIKANSDSSDESNAKDVEDSDEVSH